MFKILEELKKKLNIMFHNCNSNIDVNNSVWSPWGFNEDGSKKGYNFGGGGATKYTCKICGKNVITYHQP